MILGYIPSGNQTWLAGKTIFSFDVKLEMLEGDHF